MIRRLVPSWTAFFRVNAHESMEPFEPQSVLIGIVSVGNSPAQREREGGEERQNRIGDDLGGCFLACRNPFEKDLIPFERTLIPMRVLCDSSSQLASRRRRLGSKRTARKRLAESATYWLKPFRLYGRPGSQLRWQARPKRDFGRHSYRVSANSHELTK